MAFFPNDYLAFGLSFFYVLLIVGAAKFLRGKGVSSNLLRELTHMSMGVWPLLWFLFETKFVAFLVPLIVTIMLAVAPSSIRQVFSSGEEKHIGLVFYAFSFTVITWFFFMDFAGAAAIFSLAFADGLGGLIGSRFGKHKYKIPWVKEKSIEGSLTIFIISSLAIIAAQLIFSTGVCLLITLIGGIFVTIIEAISPYHTDNLTIPLLLAPLLYIL